MHKGSTGRRGVELAGLHPQLETCHVISTASVSLSHCIGQVITVDHNSGHVGTQTGES
jgi:hypothetical protein